MHLCRALCLAIALCPVPALAVEMADGGSCRNGAFPTEQRGFALARVSGVARLYLLADMEGCPGKGEPACRQRSYVVGGDTVVTGGLQGGYRCAFFPNNVGGSAGWVDAQRLQPLPTPTAPVLHAWAGRWHDGDNTLQLSVRGEQLAVSGEAFWPAANPGPQSPYGPHLGQIEALARPHGATVDFSEGEASGCQLRARLLGDYLVVSDNSDCGGMNVRFNGVYRRAAAKR